MILWVLSAAGLVVTVVELVNHNSARLCLHHRARKAKET